MAEQQYVPLPLSVDNLIENICKEQNQIPPDSSLRRQLAAIGEEQALDILRIISKSSRIRCLSAYIRHMLKHTSSQSLSPSKPVPPSSSQPHPAYLALGELEFRKSFLLLNYIGGKRLEDVATAEYIRSLKDLSMETFEKRIWETLGKYISRESDRRLYLDWDSGRTHVYQCYVFPDGSLRFKGPILQSTRTHLQKSIGDENVLLVKFSEDRSGRNSRTSAQEANNDLYRKFGKEGILVGLRRYHFFVFKDGGKEEKKKDPTTSSVKCYFVRMESYHSADEGPLSNKTMFEARSLFMHVHMLPNVDKYMARFSLILSKTLKLDLDWETVNVQTIQDVYCLDEHGNIVYHDGKPRILTDGTGFISEDLAVLCPKNVLKGSTIKNEYEVIGNLVDNEDSLMAMGEAELSTQQPPLLIQCRLFHMGSAMKGTLLVNKKLPPRTIQVRPSMIKVERDSSLSNTQSINSLEVVATSNRPNRTYLSKNLIALLSYGGVPNEFFMDVLQSNLEDADNVYSNKRAALRASINHGDMDEYNAAAMILCGIPLDEPHLKYRLSILAKEEMKRLRGGKLYLPDCFYLMGTVDPTGCLQKNEVCIIHESGQITGDVLVYRNPGLHFGDIHVMHARYVEELESYVGHSKYAIFFPCVGPRSVADEIAGGDYDGDTYWVSKHPQLLHHFKKSDPWIEKPPRSDSFIARSSKSTDKKPSEFSSEELEEELFRRFLETRFQPSNAMGVAADSWMAHMDRLLTLRNYFSNENGQEHVKETILEVINIYYKALDAPKQGGKYRVPPDLAAEMFPHYMENKDRFFTSTSILGLIYDEVCRWQTKEDMSGLGIKKLSCFDVEIPPSCMEKWKGLYEKYRKDMADVVRDSSRAKDEPAEVIKKYKQKLYDAATMADSPKNDIDIYNEALAIYHVTYNYAIENKSVGKCGFAWNVAGPALTCLFALKQNQNGLTCVPSVLREIFG